VPLSVPPFSVLVSVLMPSSVLVSVLMFFPQ
jgi:hypothetical protein